jgi:hypothetical protein
MGDRYQGLGRETRGGCLVAAVVGLIALLFDVGRVIGDPAPGTEDLWWRQIPVFVPTFVVVVATFLGVRALIKRNKPDGS